MISRLKLQHAATRHYSHFNDLKTKNTIFRIPKHRFSKILILKRVHNISHKQYTGEWSTFSLRELQSRQQAETDPFKKIHIEH